MPADPSPSRALSHPLRWTVAFAVLGAIYLYGLDHAPVYLGGDEAHFAVHGHAIAQDGRNLDGMRFPLFVNLWDPLGDQQPLDLKNRWYQPMLFYITALELTVLPLNEWTLRLPVALIAGLLIPWMMFMVGRRLLRDEQLALLAAVIVALSPTHLILGRQALDYVLPLPFVLGWLWYLLAYLENGRPRDAFIGGVLLGVGFYSYIASWIFMPLCLALGWVAYARSRHHARQACLWSAAGFLLPLLPALPWFAAHPEMLRDTFARYQTDSTNTATLVERISAVVFSRSWSTKLEDYASFFNPVILFVRGGPVPTTSLGRAGFFLLPVAVLLPSGIVALLLKRRLAAGSTLVLLAGLLLSPVPALFAGEPGMIQRSLFMLPFAAFIAAAGAGALRDSARGWLRTGAVLLVAAMPVQFAYVYFDYFTHYKLRSAFYYDAVAFGNVADHLVAAASTRDIPAVYLMHDLDDAGSKWRFYLIKHQREDLLTKTHYVDAGDAILASPPPGAFLVMYSAQQVLKDILDNGRWRVVRSILDVDNREAAIILEATEPPR